MLDIITKISKKVNPPEVVRGRVTVVNKKEDDVYSIELEVDNKKRTIAYTNNFVRVGDTVIIANPFGTKNAEVIISWNPLRVQRTLTRVGQNDG
jgi:hypothetical protein